MTKRLKKTGVVDIQCDAHPHMRALITREVAIPAKGEAKLEVEIK